MTISEKILAIDWHNFDTAYGNAAKDIPYYVQTGDNRGYVPNVAQSLLNLFLDKKKLRYRQVMICGAVCAINILLCHRQHFQHMMFYFMVYKI